MIRITVSMCAFGATMLLAGVYYFNRSRKEPVTREPGVADVYYSRGLALGTPGAILFIGNGISLVVYLGLKAVNLILRRMG